MPGESVLIIEDDSTLLRGLKDNFASKGFRVRTACDGEEGLQAALAGRSDLIILDLMLPKMNGYEICQAVRERDLDMPIIMLTAKGQEEDIIRGLNVGADDYVTKPFSIKELLARADAFLRRRQTAVSEVYRFGDCELNIASHKLFQSGVEVPLTPKEFRLLEYFVKRAGRALTRDDILNSVWGNAVVVTSRSVDRCMTTLRSKIEPDPRHPTYIQTILDIGYRFEMPEPETPPDQQRAAPQHDYDMQPDAFVSLTGGDRLGRYEIRSLLGRGGMAEVYRARDSQLDRDVAIKVLSKDLAQDHDGVKRFEREAKAVAALSHPNILAIYDVAKDQGVDFAVMELLEGETLRERLERSSLGWREALQIAKAVAQGLAAAHRKGVIHRDVKPGNIFLTSNGGVKILDFGLARLDKAVPFSSSGDVSTVTAKTSPGTVMGTAAYMSPEQVRGQKTDARSDVFSLGCVLYEMLSGKPPFWRGTAADTMAAILKDTPPEIARFRRALPPGLDRAIAHCLEKDPEDRFQSAHDLAFALCGVGQE